VGIRPENVVVGDGPDALPGRIEITEQLGPEMLVHVDVPGLTLAAAAGDEARPDGRLVARAPGTFKGARGDRVGVAFDRGHLQLFDPESGDALP
jgi:ABC-type sugar transport system ATPase subunit